MVHFVLKGGGFVRAAKASDHGIDAAWLVIVPAGTRHALETRGEIGNELQLDAPPEEPPIHRIIAGSANVTELMVACGIVDVRYGQTLGLFDHLKEVLALDLSGIPQVVAAFEGIFAEQAAPSPGGEAMTGALMTQCLVHFFRRLSVDQERTIPWLMALEDRRLGRAIDAMLDHPGAEHTVESLGEAAAMSRSSFAKHFAEAFGLSPMTFLHRLRMERAAEMLAADESSIDAIAIKVGFSSRSHFSRAFKKHTGVSPNEFRERASGNQALVRTG